MKTIMVVDDESNILDDIKSALEENNFQVITADNNRQALELMQNDTNDDFGLILIDTDLPDCDKSALFSMKPNARKDINTSDSSDYLQKPFTKQQLLDFVQSKMKD